MKPSRNIHVIPTENPSRLWLTKLGNLTRCHDIKPIKEVLGNNVNIYITSNEDIKEGDWFIANNGVHKCIRVAENTSCPFITLNSKGEEIGHFKTWRTKIILTTDQDLIKDGVQAINDEFLEWFVKNPNCEEVEVESVFISKIDTTIFIPPLKRNKIIIPKEEPKQELHSIDDEVECNNCGNLMSLTEDESIYACYNSECTSCYEEYEEEPKQETLEEVAERLYPIILEDDGWDKNKQYRDEWIEGVKYEQERSCSDNEELISLLKQTTEYEVLQSFRDKVEQFKKK